MAGQCQYENQIAEAASLVAARQTASHEWSIAWQSRSGSPRVPWLEPDVNDHLRRLRDRGIRGATIVPIGFVSDHFEVLFDLDKEASATAAAIGLAITRAAAPGTSPEPEFVAMWRQLIEERLSGDSPRLGIGSLEPIGDACQVGCCPPG